MPNEEYAVLFLGIVLGITIGLIIAVSVFVIDSFDGEIYTLFGERFVRVDAELEEEVVVEYVKPFSGYCYEVNGQTGECLSTEKPFCSTAWVESVGETENTIREHAFAFDGRYLGYEVLYCLEIGGVVDGYFKMP